MLVGNIGPRCRQMTRGNMFCILSTIIVLVFRGIVIVLLVDITIRYCGFCSNRILLYFPYVLGLREGSKIKIKTRSLGYSWEIEL